MQWWKKLILILMFLTGLGIALYPTISNWYNSHLFVLEAESYEANVGNLTDEQLAAEWDKARVYNENLMGDPVHDPFVPGSGVVLPDNYTDCLNVEGIMGYVKIPKIDVYLPLYHGTSEKALSSGVGHIESTALPIGQEGTHPVLTGHTGLPEAKLFTDLDKLVIGDTFYLHILDETLCYKVDQITVILPEELEALRPVPGHDYVTLLTCTPYGVNSHRLLVRGERCFESEEPPVVNTGLGWWHVAVIAAASASVLVAALLMRRRRQRRKQAVRKGLK